MARRSEKRDEAKAEYCARRAKGEKVNLKEMAESMALDLLDKGMVTDQLVLSVGYDIVNLTDPSIRSRYKGETTIDHYGRQVPKHAHGSINLDEPTSSVKLITDAATRLFDRIVQPGLLVRRLNLTVNHIVSEQKAGQTSVPVQYDLFTDYAAIEKEQREKKHGSTRNVGYRVLC